LGESSNKNKQLKVFEFTSNYQAVRPKIIKLLNRVKSFSNQCINYPNNTNNQSNQQSQPQSELSSIIETDTINPDLQLTSNITLDNPINFMDLYRNEPITSNIKNIFIPNTGYKNPILLNADNYVGNEHNSNNSNNNSSNSSNIDDIGLFKLPFTGLYIFKFNRKFYGSSYNYGYSFPNTPYTDITYVVIPQNFTYRNYKEIFIEKFGKDILFDLEEPLLFYPIIYPKVLKKYIENIQIANSSEIDIDEILSIINKETSIPNFLKSIIDGIRKGEISSNPNYNITKKVMRIYDKFVQSLFTPPYFDYYIKINNVQIQKNIRDYIVNDIINKYFLGNLEFNNENKTGLLRLLFNNGLINPPFPVPNLYSKTVFNTITKILENYDSIFSYIFSKIISKYLLGMMEQNFVLLISLCQPNIHTVLF